MIENAWAIMNESHYVVDVTGADFSQQVVDKSHEVPVLVDFWAPWCGPCRMLAPILHRLADAYAGKLYVAKVNTDVEQELALKFQIRGIPAVKLFRRGEVVGEFVGVQTESAVRALVEPFLPNEIDDLLEQSALFTRDGKISEAIALLRESTARHPQDDRIKLALAKLLVSLAPADGVRERLGESQALLDSLSLRAASDPEVETLRMRLDLMRAVTEAPTMDKLERTVNDDAGNNDARFALAARLALTGDYQRAMDQFLEIVRRDRSFRDDGARKALVGLFNLLGGQHPLSIKYRGLLSRALN
jgi:putative thioredoxin